MYNIGQDPSPVIHVIHECSGLILCADCECLVVDMLECTLDHCISLHLGFKYTIVQIDVLYNHFLTIDCHIP